MEEFLLIFLATADYADFGVLPSAVARKAMIILPFLTFPNPDRVAVQCTHNESTRTLFEYVYQIGRHSPFSAIGLEILHTPLQMIVKRLNKAPEV